MEEDDDDDDDDDDRVLKEFLVGQRLLYTE